MELIVMSLVIVGLLVVVVYLINRLDKLSQNFNRMYRRNLQDQRGMVDSIDHLAITIKGMSELHKLLIEFSERGKK